MKKTVLNTIKYPYFEIKHERIEDETYGPVPIELESAYDLQGLYLGDVQTAKYLCFKQNIIHFEKRTEDSSIASIGLNRENTKWFGWSHRAIRGFGIGDKFYDGFSGNEGSTISTMNEAKDAAKQFAESVS